MDFLDNTGENLHILSSLVCGQVALDIVECLPECDLLQELSHILTIQNDVLNHVMKDKHFGSERLDTFMSMLSHLQYETRKLRNANKEN